MRPCEDRCIVGSRGASQLGGTFQGTLQGIRLISYSLTKLPSWYNKNTCLMLINEMNRQPMKSYTMLCLLKVNSNTIILTKHTSCYYVWTNSMLAGLVRKTPLNPVLFHFQIDHEPCESPRLDESMFKQAMSSFNHHQAAVASAASLQQGYPVCSSASSYSAASELLNRYRLEQTIKQLHGHGFQDPRSIGIPFSGSNQQVQTKKHKNNDKQKNNRVSLKKLEKKEQVQFRVEYFFNSILFFIFKAPQNERQQLLTAVPVLHFGSCFKLSLLPQSKRQKGPLKT